MSRPALRNALLALHSTLLAHTRAEYERANGRVENPAEMLQLVVGDSAFAWLLPLSGLIVALDEADESVDHRALTEKLFAPGNAFYEPYLEALQRSPDVVVEHAAVKSALAALPRVASA